MKVSTVRLALLFILLSACDATFTVAFILGGYGFEANPVMSLLTKNLSLFPVVKVGLTSIVAVVAVTADRRERWGRYGLIAGIIFYLGVLIWNYKELLFG